MAVFKVGDFTVYPHVTGAGHAWRGHFSITTPDGNGGEQRFGVSDVEGSFATEDQAMEAARAAGRHRANELVESSRIERGD
jgi:hypothetical protein